MHLYKIYSYIHGISIVRWSELSKGNCKHLFSKTQIQHAYNKKQRCLFSGKALFFSTTMVPKTPTNNYHFHVYRKTHTKQHLLIHAGISHALFTSYSGLLTPFTYERHLTALNNSKIGGAETAYTKLVQSTYCTSLVVCT